MSNDKYLSNLSKKKFYRVFAWVCLIILLALFITTVVLAITGSEYYLPVLLITIFTPVFMYIILWLGRVLSSGNDMEIVEDNAEKKENDGEEKK